MTQSIFRFLVLIICSCFPSQIRAQEIHLELRAANAKEDRILEDLQIEQKYRNYESVVDGIRKLRDTLQQLGYFEYRISDLTRIMEDRYQANITLGTQIKTLRIHFADKAVDRYASQLGLDPSENSFEIATASSEAILKSLAELEARSGEPLSYFQLRNFRLKDSILNADLILSRDRKRSIDSLAIKGYAKFPKSFLKYYVRLKKEQTFNRDEIIRKSRRLNALNFVSQSRDPEVLFTRDSTTVFLYLQKTEANRFEGFLGFGTNENTGDLRLDGYLDLFLLNNLNYGESLKLNYKSDGNNQQNFRLALTLPYLFKSALGITAELNLFRRDSTFSTAQQKLDLFYQLSHTTRLISRVNFESSNNLSDTQSSLLVRDYKKNEVSAGISITNPPDSGLFPTGNSFDILGGYGQRQTSINSDQQFFVEALATHTFKINPRHQFNVDNMTRVLFSENYLSNELYRFGGINSLRGFQENSINANLFSVFRTEYRFIPASNLYLHTITDAAYFENEILGQQELLYSVGFGAGLITGAGLLQLNLANGMQKGQEFRFSNSILHLRFIAFF